MDIDELNQALALDGPPCWFSTPGPMRSELIRLVQSGTKTATAGLIVEFEMYDEPIPVPGMRSAIIDNDSMVVGVMTTSRRVTARFIDVTWEFAEDEGEGFVDLADWRRQHRQFWESVIVPMVRDHYDRGFVFDDDTLVSCEWFSYESVDPAVPWPGRPEAL